jgi:choline dehydrogenase-like flavoprotein
LGASNSAVVFQKHAIHTPKLLMQSGIGDEAELKRVDTPVLQALPGVGRNLHDHVAFGCVWEKSEKALPGVPRSQRTRAYPNKWPYISCQRGSQVASCESTAGIARVSLPDGLASEAPHRSASCVASRGDAISYCEAQWVIQGHRMAKTHATSGVAAPFSAPEPIAGHPW